MLKQYCLEGILAKESSVTTIDFLLCRDLQKIDTLGSGLVSPQKIHGKLNHPQRNQISSKVEKVHTSALKSLLST